MIRYLILFGVIASLLYGVYSAIVAFGLLDVLVFSGAAAAAGFLCLFAVAIMGGGRAHG